MWWGCCYHGGDDSGILMKIVIEVGDDGGSDDGGDDDDWNDDIDIDSDCDGDCDCDTAADVVTTATPRAMNSKAAAAIVMMTGPGVHSGCHAGRLCWRNARLMLAVNDQCGMGRVDGNEE